MTEIESNLKASRIRVIFCVGMFRSGSTWAFNIVLSLMTCMTLELRIKTCYADNLDVVQPWLESPMFDLIIIKSHCPDRSMLSFIQTSDYPVILTVRDARDCLASWLQHFGGTFQTVEQMFMRSCVIMTELAKSDKACLLRYESGSTRSIESVYKISKILGLNLSHDDAERIFREWMPESVSRKISELIESGKIDSANVMSTDPTTMWSRDHLGDGRNKKFLESLSNVDIVSVNYWSRAYAQAFNYEVALPEPLSKGETVLKLGQRSTSLYYLTKGFSFPENGFIWTDGTAASIELPLDGELSDGFQCEFHCTTFSPKAIQFSILLAERIVWNSGTSGPSPSVLGLSVVEPKLRGQSRLSLALVFDNLRSPREQGISSDDRQLGLAMETFVLRY